MWGDSVVGFALALTNLPDPKRMEPLGRNGKKQKGSKINAITDRIDRLLAGEDLVILRISRRIAGQDVNMLRTLLEQEQAQ